MIAAGQTLNQETDDMSNDRESQLREWSYLARGHSVRRTTRPPDFAAHDRYVAELIALDRGSRARHAAAMIANGVTLLPGYGGTDPRKPDAFPILRWPRQWQLGD
jgi:hypothetical protein